jgi:putative ABC transport system permease protein
MLLARYQEIHLERETLVALVRGLVQVVAVGSVVLLVLQSPTWVSIPVLLAMVVAGAVIASRRAGGLSDAFYVSLAAIGLGAGLVIVSMTLLGVIDPAPSSLIPVGSMVIASAMNADALAMDRFRSEVVAHTGQIEAALALGAEPARTVKAVLPGGAQSQPHPGPQLPALAGHRLDPGVDGRHDSVGCRPGVRRHLPVCRHCDALCCEWPDLAGLHALDPFACLFAGAATTAAA